MPAVVGPCAPVPYPDQGWVAPADPELEKVCTSPPSQSQVTSSELYDATKRVICRVANHILVGPGVGKFVSDFWAPPAESERSFACTWALFHTCVAVT